MNKIETLEKKHEDKKINNITLDIEEAGENMEASAPAQ
jgi:hypothetical protein